MKIAVIGATGDIGTVVVKELGKRHEIIAVSRTRGDYCVGVSDYSAVQNMYQKIGTLDAVVSCLGDASFEPLEELTHDAFMIGLRQKVMGQVNLVLAGLDYIAEAGSFTLTSGVLDRDPIRMGTNAATANGALAGFVKSAAIELPPGIRVNVVSPGMLDVSEPRYGEWFRGHKPVKSTDVGLAYLKSVEGALTGQVIIVE